MQPVDATSGTRSLTTVQVAVPSTKTARTDSVVEQIPMVEPRPHYPISASVAEIMAHITELIKEQQTASQEALHQKNLEEARAEMEKLFEAVQRQSDDAVNSNEATDSLSKADGKKVKGIDGQTIKVPDNEDNKVMSFDNTGDVTNTDGTTDDRLAKGVHADNSGKINDTKTTSKNNGRLPHLPSDVKAADKKNSSVGTDSASHDALQNLPDNAGNVEAGSGNSDYQPEIDNNVVKNDTLKENI
ncbi:unnamed protein product [Bartonella choladocola]